jgi:hypothetical protein
MAARDAHGAILRRVRASALAIRHPADVIWNRRTTLIEDYLSCTLGDSSVSLHIVCSILPYFAGQPNAKDRRAAVRVEGAGIVRFAWAC